MSGLGPEKSACADCGFSLSSPAPCFRLERKGLRKRRVALDANLDLVGGRKLACVIRLAGSPGNGCQGTAPGLGEGLGLLSQICPKCEESVYLPTFLYFSLSIYLSDSSGEAGIRTLGTV